MATTLWKAFRPYIARHVKQCPTFEMDDAAREAAREFCRMSHAWRVRGLTLLTTVADQADYTYVSPPTDAELWRVHAAWFGDDESDEVDIALPGESDNAPPAHADSCWRIEAVPTNLLRLSPLPSAAAVVIKGTLSFMPSVAATGLLSTLFDEHHHGLASGAVAMLAAQPDKPWSNPTIVTFHEGKFGDAIRKASNDAGPVRRRPLRVTPW